MPRRTASHRTYDVQQVRSVPGTRPQRNPNAITQSVRKLDEHISIIDAHDARVGAAQTNFFANARVGGSLARGDEVDVYVADASVADRLTRAEVLDTSVLADGGGDLSWVTLAVDASAVRDVLAATTRGEVTLVLPGASASREAARSERANNEGSEG